MTTREENNESEPTSNGTHGNMKLAARLSGGLTGLDLTKTKRCHESTDSPDCACTNGIEAKQYHPPTLEADEPTYKKENGLNSSEINSLRAFPDIDCKCSSCPCICIHLDSPTSTCTSGKETGTQNGIHNGFESLIKPNLPEINGTHDPETEHCHEVNIQSHSRTNSSSVLDASNASYFSIPDDRLASPGSESMVTASEGGSSRSCSSLSCPSSGSSASSLVFGLSPDRDSVEVNHGLPTLCSVNDDLLLQNLAAKLDLDEAPASAIDIKMPKKESKENTLSNEEIVLHDTSTGTLIATVDGEETEVVTHQSDAALFMASSHGNHFASEDDLNDCCCSISADR